MQATVFFKALSDDTRLTSLLMMCSQGELCVCELVHALALSQPKISRHLAQLRQDGLITDRRQGKWVYYSVNPALPEWAKVTLAQTLQANEHLIVNQIQLLKTMHDRPVREIECC